VTRDCAAPALYHAAVSSPRASNEAASASNESSKSTSAPPTAASEKRSAASDTPNAASEKPSVASNTLSAASKPPNVAGERLSAASEKAAGGSEPSHAASRPAQPGRETAHGASDRPITALGPRAFPYVPFDDYRLLDSGLGEKLERFGPVVLRRPDPQALWSRRLPEAAWTRADLKFVRESDRGGRWEARRGAHELARADEPEWTVSIGSARFLVRPTPFKHVGVFPEQSSNWALLAGAAKQFSGARPRLLNLFAYTGVASVIAARTGFEVTHVDASRTSLSWTRDNLRASELPADCVRIVLDDALAFARREARRDARYHAILLDPPHYGRGPNGEKWQFEDHVASLLEIAKELLEERAFAILSTYAIGCSPLALHNLMCELGAGQIECGELAIPETIEDERSGASSNAVVRGPLFLPAGFCARWSRGIDLAQAANGA
jgi:23S rRNA (cytosine1962-C5)-methyltransferase